MSPDLIIHPTSLEKLKDYKLPNLPLPFGQVICPIMLICDYKNGSWGKMEILPYGPLPLAPTAKVFHYAQEVFEGLKAYKHHDGNIWLFRPEKNMQRFHQSCDRMAIPQISSDYFMESIEAISILCKDFVPSESGHSLYLRPFVIASEENLGVKPSDSYKYVVIASPSGSYFQKTTVPVFVETEQVRASTGGIGFAKTGANYAASLVSALAAKKQGKLMTLWLDAKERRFVEELSGMNFFCVINNELHTPPLSDSILDGVTRDSLLGLAKELEIRVYENKIDIYELFKQIDQGICTEAFSCGTAAIVSSIESLASANGQDHCFK